MIGLIAGSKSLPFLFAREARRRGETVVAVAFEGETDPALESEVASMEWVKVGQLSRMMLRQTPFKVVRMADVIRVISAT